MKPLALVVENDTGTRKLLDVLLRRLGFEVDLVANGGDGLLLLRNVEYGVVVLDLMMTGGSGLDVLGAIRSERPELLERVLVVSSAAEPLLQSVRERFGVTVIRKPFELASVTAAAVVTQALRQPRASTLAEQFCRRSVAAGAKAGVVVQVESMDAVAHYGYALSILDAFLPLNLDAPYPLCDAMREARPIWLPSLAIASSQYPLLVHVWHAQKTEAVAAVPLLRGGDVIGAAGWSFRETHLFSEREQQYFLGIADSLALSIAVPSRESAVSAGA